MNRSERHKANEQQIRTYFAYYDRLWRLSKLISIKYLLKNKEQFKKDLAPYYEKFAINIDSYLYSSFTNGLAFSAISETVMCIEDFLALFKYIREPERFIKYITQYSSGKVTNLHNKIQKLSTDEILKAFMIPSEKYQDSIFIESKQSNDENIKVLKIYRDGSAYIKQILDEILRCYKQFDFFHNQI